MEAQRVSGREFADVRSAQTARGAILSKQPLGSETAGAGEQECKMNLAAADLSSRIGRLGAGREPEALLVADELLDNTHMTKCL
jgi:hypothetical protein